MISFPKSIKGFCNNKKFKNLIFNNIRYVSSINNNTGLFGIDELQNSKSFQFLADRAITRCNDLRNKIVVYEINHNDLTSSVDNLLILLDNVSNEVCSVIDAAELCRNIHDDPEFISSAEEAFSTLSSYIHKLNADVTLHSRLKEITSNSIIMNKLSSESQIFAIDLQTEFESDGIHLRGQKREESMSLLAKVVSDETSFMQNAAIADDINSDLFQLGPFQPYTNFINLRNWLGQYITQTNNEPLHINCSSSRKIAQPLLRSISDEKVRSDLWIRSINQPESNKLVLGNLIKHRHELSTILGYESFAHKYLANKVAGSPEEVWKFLKQTADYIRPKAEKEIAILTDLKSKLSARDNIKSSDLQPWDIAYLCGMHQSMKQQSDNGVKNNKALTEICNYFPLDACIEGLKNISKELFDIELISEEISPNESWISILKKNSDNNLSDKNGVLKFRVKGANGENLGLVYMDLFQRRGKFPGAAHFTVRCGCKSKVGSSNDEDYQEPIVALVFNFSPTSFQNNSSTSFLAGSLLSMQELETFYHEWGHALHSLLSRTTFQHLSGTRGAVDFVEVPSHLFEYFARESSVVATWARHYNSGVSIPSGLLEEALEMKSSFQAIDLQTQLLYSAADQFVFGPQIGDISNLSPEDIYQKAMIGVRDVQKKFTNLPLANNTDIIHPAAMSALTHSHFINYGGGYYSYLFAKMYAAQIWDKQFAFEPLSRKSGLYLWNNMLQFGAAKDKKIMLNDLAGGPLDPSYFLKSL